MSQGAVIIPTTPPLPGATLVSDINVALGALASANSGSTAPTLGPGGGGALVEGQVWLDTSVTPHQLRRYDGTSFVPFFGQFNALMSGAFGGI